MSIDAKIAEHEKEIARHKREIADLRREKHAQAEAKADVDMKRLLPGLLKTAAAATACESSVLPILLSARQIGDGDAVDLKWIRDACGYVAKVAAVSYYVKQCGNNVWNAAQAFRVEKNRRHDGTIWDSTWSKEALGAMLNVAAWRPISPDRVFPTDDLFEPFSHPELLNERRAIVKETAWVFTRV